MAKAAKKTTDDSAAQALAEKLAGVAPDGVVMVEPGTIERTVRAPEKLSLAEQRLRNGALGVDVSEGDLEKTVNFLMGRLRHVIENMGNTTYTPGSIHGFLMDLKACTQIAPMKGHVPPRPVDTRTDEEKLKALQDAQARHKEAEEAERAQRDGR